MSFLNTLIERFTGITPPAPAEATDAVIHDRFDEASWQEVREAVPAIDSTVNDLSVRHDYVEDIARDFYNLTLKGAPRVREQAEMKVSHQPNQAMISEFAKTPEIESLRSLTAGDQYAAAMAFVSMKDQLSAAVERLTEAKEKAEQQEQAEAEANEANGTAQQALQDALEALDALEAAPEDEALQEAAQTAGSVAEKAVGQAQATADKAIDAAGATARATNQATAETRGEIRKAAAQAADEAEAEEQLMRSFGVEDGDLKRMPFAERAELATKLKNNRLAKFANLIGQFKMMAAAESRRRVQHVADEVVDVELGDDLTRLTTQELTNLASEELEDDFWMRYVDKQLLVKKLEGSEKMGQGPIIVVCDESGSMDSSSGTNMHGGTREAWSKALSLALLDQARRRNRDFHYIGFSSSAQQWHSAFPEGKAPIQQVIAMTEHFWDGGTSYEKPLRMALDIIESDYNAKGHPKPDIVFITDDEHGTLNEDFMGRWNGLKDKLSLRCFGIGMGITGTNGALNAVADDVRVISSLTADPNSVGDIFRMI